MNLAWIFRLKCGFNPLLPLLKSCLTLSFQLANAAVTPQVAELVPNFSSTSSTNSMCSQDVVRIAQELEPLYRIDNTKSQL